MYSNRYTGPGTLKMELHTEATVSFIQKLIRNENYFNKEYNLKVFY